MTKTKALDLLNNAISCYVEDCIATMPKEDTLEIWQAFSVVEDVVERSIKTDGEG
jgi:hypothetical protein